jgi:hypothetical protein
MVDYDPWSGNYDGTIVRQNNIIGGLATSSPTSSQASEGTNNADAIIKSACCSVCLVGDIHSHVFQDWYRYGTSCLVW